MHAGAANFVKALFFGGSSTVETAHDSAAGPGEKLLSSQSSYLDDSDCYLSPSEEEYACSSNQKPQSSEILCKGGARQLQGPKAAP